MKLLPTYCCALAQLSANDTDTLHSLKIMILDKKREALSRDWYIQEGAPEGGHRAIFCITSPGEDTLESNLKELGFSNVYSFNRRNGYPKGYLTMWVLDW